MKKGPTTKGKKGRRGAVPMPPDHLELITRGILLPDPTDPHAMKCATCGLRVILLWNHPPVDIKTAKILPAAVWGEDVTVLCVCCSYPHCPHRPAPEVRR
jgi:hypothetical protein